MIQYINIRNVALIEELTLDFGSGLITVTGETGAGKSVLLGALSMLAGARMEKTIIGSHGDAAEVQASLYIENSSTMDPYLESLGLPCCEDNTLVLHRVINRGKMARISVNGVLTTLGNLQKLGEFWVDFHGPGEPQKLFKNSIQLELLDLFSGHKAVLVEYKSLYSNWTGVLSEIDHLKNTTAISPDEMDFLRSQLDQIEAFELTDEAVERLEDDYNRIERAQEYQDNLDIIEEAFNGSNGILSRTGQSLKAAKELAEIDSTLDEFLDRIENLQVETEDLSTEVRALYANMDIDVHSIQEIKRKMNRWMELRRRYGQNVQQVQAKRDSMQKRIADSSNMDERLHELEKEADVWKNQLEEKAAIIRKRRKTCALELSKRVAKILNDLGFKKAQLRIEIVPEKDLKEWGDCYCEFMFSANAGHTVQPLRKIASSGETARVMLAFKTVLAEFDNTPVLVFDEVDANVGGEVGSSVGGLLGSLSSDHQVFCVTHLPQVACQGNEHYLVEKVQGDASTDVSIRPIHKKKSDRLTELARMLGDRNSKTAQSMAKELLQK
tara:strand:- start:989 stop:2650 length:1662 start_codon:yes stop_codon:yes gene_type:complete